MEDKKLWRYYDLIKFLTLINGEIYFARADSFKDKYEGALPKKNFEAEIGWLSYDASDLERKKVIKEVIKKVNEKKKKAAISCWHINESESAAMWDIYSKAGMGIAVSTTLDKL